MSIFSVCWVIYGAAKSKLTGKIIGTTRSSIGPAYASKVQSFRTAIHQRTSASPWTRICADAPPQRAVAPSQATRNGIRAGDLRDPETFAAKLRVLALDGSKRFQGFEYDVEADIEAYKGIAERVLPMCAPCLAEDAVE